MGLPRGRRHPPLLVGVVHLLPLPGAPQRSPGLDTVLARAVADATALVRGGADGVIVENLGDAPFVAEQVDPWTVAAMTRIGLAVRQAAPDLLLGINVLRNDARAALSIAAAVGGDFLRVNVHTGAMLTDQGVITGRARETLLERNRLGASVSIAADLLVKHAVPLGPVQLRDVARDTWGRGGADALILTGAGTGLPTDPAQIATVRAVLPDATVWVGSGLDPSRTHAVRQDIDGAIVGTWLHRDGDLTAPLDPQRVAAMAEALRR